MAVAGRIVRRLRERGGRGGGGVVSHFKKDLRESNAIREIRHVITRGRQVERVHLPNEKQAAKGKTKQQTTTAARETEKDNQKNDGQREQPRLIIARKRGRRGILSIKRCYV